ncbi:SHOCT domain-containing protein [Aquincola sp. MAHUQ-54]|uniref:SHOCT domain-containing protein n=1 Tax=Aquincola agrisoli TaxID=3119538 RepID=A0AAW9QA55_9BURK
MRQLSPEGRAAIEGIAMRHGFSVDAVVHMLEAVANGNGGMAQFNHPEFAGSGQWMRGGMTMVSDMFNNHLKGRVDGLCAELSNLVANEPGLLQGGSFQSQSQGGQPPQFQSQGGHGGDRGAAGQASLFVPPSPGTGGDWWPADLRWPSSTGTQNQVRYAHFAQAHRLAIDLGGRVTVYDTLDHDIGGFSQQQSSGGSLSFHSQHGLVDVASLPVVWRSDGNTPAAPSPSYAPAPAPAAVAAAAGEGADVFATIERLAALAAKGILTAEEFNAKKAELLGRL